MNPRALLLPALPVVLAGLAWWGAGGLVTQFVKPQPAPVVAQIVLPPGIESMAPAGARPPLGYLELSAFGFSEPPKPKPVAKVTKPKVPTAADLYVVESVLNVHNIFTATMANKTVAVGDKLDQKYTVISINAEGVWVLGPGKQAKPEKIGFRPYTAVAEKPAGASQDASGAQARPDASPPPGMRDFRQILETLKL